MDKETLSHYGWIVILVLILAVLLALASPFGNFVAGAIKATTAGFFSVNESALGAAGITIPGQNFENGEAKEPAPCNIEGHYIGDGRGEHMIPVDDCLSNHTYTCECSIWTVPEGGKYTMKTAVDGKSEYVAEEQLPCGYKTEDRDTYEYGDYIYTYYSTPSVYNDVGWSVELNMAVTNRDKTSYGPILESINGEPITTLWETFSNCTSLQTSPVVPESVTHMRRTFTGCWSLTTAPIIPEGVTNLVGTFYECVELKTYAGSTDADGDFSNYKLPEGITSLSGTFYNCSNLTTAPVVPEGATYLYQAFCNCSKLTGAIEINSNPTNWSMCIYNTQIAEITGSTTMAQSIMLTKTSRENNPTAPVVPDGPTISQSSTIPFSSITYGKKLMPDGSLASTSDATFATEYYIDVSSLNDTFWLCYLRSGGPIRVAQYDSNYNSLSTSFGLNGCTTQTSEYAAWEITKLEGCKYIRIFLSGGWNGLDGELCNTLS